MKKEVIESREAYVPKFKRVVQQGFLYMSVILVSGFISCFLISSLVAYLLGDPYEPDSFAVTIPHTQEVEPLNAGVTLIRTAYGWDFREPIYTEKFFIPERCLIYRGSTLYMHNFVKEGDWVIAEYSHALKNSVDECPENSRILMRDSVFKSWQGQFELAEQDAADKALLLRRY